MIIQKKRKVYYPYKRQNKFGVAFKDLSIITVAQIDFKVPFPNDYHRNAKICPSLTWECMSAYVVLWVVSHVTFSVCINNKAKVHRDWL